MQKTRSLLVQKQENNNPATPAPETADVSLRIRGMVCDRCRDVVRNELVQAGFEVLTVQLGQLTLRGPLSSGALDTIRTLLTNQGFGLLADQIPVHQRAKALIDTYFSDDDLSERKTRLSTLLQEELHLDYDTISGQFAKSEGITVEKYIILRRIDKVKERLVYSNLTLTEIAHRTGYSSVQHLSNQFRQQTGLTPSYFRQVRQQKQTLQEGEPPAEISQTDGGIV